MQAYSRGFSRVYNLKWGGFARQIAPYLLDFYANTPAGRENKPILDLCCGTGYLAMCFLEKGYRVVGIDLSENMLQWAQEAAHSYIQSAQAVFIQGDAANFTLAERFGLVVSTYDALNHLENEQALVKCFECVHAVCDGYFIFDLNTRCGLRQWNSIHVDDRHEDAMIVTRGFFDEQSGRAWTRISGFIRLPDGYYERFEQTAFNTVFDMEKVKNALLDIGWKHAYFAAIQDLNTPIDDPEKQSRVFIVASK